MAQRCKLCRRRLTDRTQDADCACGWTLDGNCEASHRNWCPAHGEDRWVGAVEL